jgi:L-2,4-diaminobutyrate transaminase
MGHGWTYSAHPIGTAAGVANLKLIDSLGLVDNAATVGGYLNAAMRDAFLNHPNVGEVRGEGLLCAVEFVRDRDARTFFEPSEKIGPRVAAALVNHGVIARAMPQGEIIGFAPPLCLTKEEADIVVAKMQAAVSDVL